MKLGELLSKGANELGIEITENQEELFLLYLDNLKKWNRSINITAIRDDGDILLNHFVDSISVCKFIKNSGSVLDIGSGGGFPGLPIKIVCSDLHVTLLDSVNKKVSFLNDTIRKLGLKNIEAVWGRAEDLDNGITKKSYDYVITRAVGSIPEIIFLSLPYVSENGVIILMRGKTGMSEWREVQDEVLNIASLEHSVEFTLPFTEKRRSILILKPL